MSRYWEDGFDERNDNKVQFNHTRTQRGDLSLPCVRLLLWTCLSGQRYWKYLRYSKKFEIHHHCFLLNNTGANYFILLTFVGLSGRINEPTRCPREECKATNSMSLVHNRCRFVILTLSYLFLLGSIRFISSNGSTLQVTKLDNNNRFADKQIVKLLETPDEIPDGGTPHTVSVLMHDKLVDTGKPGDRVEV